MALTNNDDSAWGSVEGFFDHIDSGPKNKRVINVESEVWGKLRSKDLKPNPGDGFAFYHTTRALFERSDPFRGRPRISLMGELKDLRQDGQFITWISVEINRVEMKYLRSRPIIRDEKTEPLFRQCGIVRGSVATYFEVPSNSTLLE